MEMHEFINTLKILRAIDYPELEQVGLVMSKREFTSFLQSPYSWIIYATDEDAKKLWSIIVKRSSKT